SPVGQGGVAARDGRGRGHRLEAAVAAAAAADPRPYGEVADLRGLAAVPPQQAPAGDDGGRDTGADGHEHEVFDALVGGGTVLGHAPGGDVVSDAHRQRPGRLEVIHELEVAPPDVRAVRR